MVLLPDLFNFNLSGIPLALGTCLVDWFVLIISKTLWSLYVNSRVKEYNKLRREQKEAENRQDVKAMALAGRKLREIKSSKKPYVSRPKFLWILLLLRKILPMIIFRNCWICTTKLDFWKPFTYAISYPHNDQINLETNEVKIGFVLFWFYL